MYYSHNFIYLSNLAFSGYVWRKRLLVMGLLQFPEQCQFCKDAGLCEKELPPKWDIWERFWNAHEDLLVYWRVTKGFSFNDIRLFMMCLGHCQIRYVTIQSISAFVSFNQYLASKHTRTD